MNWRELPLVRILLPFMAGIIPAYYLPQSLFPFSFLLLCFLAPGLILWPWKSIRYPFRLQFGAYLNLFLLVLAYQYCFFILDLNKRDHFNKHLTKINWIEGAVKSSKTTSNHLQLILQLKAITDTLNRWQKCSGNLLIYLPKEAVHNKPLYGDRFKAKVAIRQIKLGGNPRAFDFAAHMKQKNVLYQSFIKDGHWEFNPSKASFHPFRWAKHLQNRCLEILQNHFKDPDDWSVAKALILGNREEITSAVKAAYASSGAMHVLAVSGLHVGIICIMLNGLLWFLPKHSLWIWLRISLLLLGIWTFALMTGASASVLRASTMFSFLLFGKALNRYTNIYNTLAASAFLLLLINPLVLFDIGFQLSYTALLGIIYFQPRIYKLLYCKRKVFDFIWKLITVSIAAQISTLPISLFYFHQIPVYFWLSGIVVIPAAAMMLNLGFLVLLSNPLPFIHAIAGKLLCYLVKGCNAVIFFIESLPGSLVSGIWISLITLWLLYFIIGGLCIALSFKRFKGLLFSLICLNLLSFSHAYETWNGLDEARVIIYQLNRYSAIDIFLGKQVISLKDPELSEEKLAWAVGNNRDYYRVKKVINQGFEDSFGIESKDFYYNEGCLHFEHLTLLIFDGAAVSCHLAGAVDYIMVRKNGPIDLNLILRNYQPKKIIFDTSNSPYQVAQWKKQCLQLGLDFVDIRDSGAFQINL